MNVENDMPQAFIIAETKLNTQSVESAVLATNDKKWSDELKKRNLNVTLTDIEKLPETIAELTGNFQNSKNLSTEEYNKIMVSYGADNPLFKHITATVSFVNVSRDFCFLFREFAGGLTVSDMNRKEISFWVPPAIMVDEQMAVQYGTVINDLGQKIEALRNQAFKSKLDTPDKIVQAFDSLYPDSVAVNAVATGSISDWKNFILTNAQFQSPDESRYIFMHLARTMKMKWATLFYDVVVEDTAGKQYGLDTVNSAPMAFKALRLSIKKG